MPKPTPTRPMAPSTSATKLMDRASVLAAQGATFTLDAAGRQSIAGEAQSLLEQMVAISRTTVQGRYIFGGDQRLHSAL